MVKLVCHHETVRETGRFTYIQLGGQNTQILLTNNYLCGVTKVTGGHFNISAPPFVSQQRIPHPFREDTDEGLLEEAVPRRGEGDR